MDIIKHKNKFFILSFVVIVIGLFTMVSRGLNYGIDFTGGTMLQIDLGKEVSVNEIREIVDKIDKDADIIHVGDQKNEIMIKTKLDLDNNERMDLFNEFKEKYGLKQETPEQSQTFQPAIGDEIQNKAILSILIATIGMLIYITFRFEFKFGVAAVVALMHDVLVALAVYALLRVPVNSSFVAAILTIVGYSINDTIVVFDRIRENTKLIKRGKYAELVNTSISQTIVRSINTSFTTLLAIACLYIFGVEAIKDFALPLIVGVLVGTYSSIFIASPVWYLLKKRSSGKNYKPKRV
ncbi:protein translocase subunit SecF [Clostridiisalibacter paucivorans]|uniref:protein translocase subunit SecF n=1 Tax=Clostridiisalibacter paucivorans TaxID=408753 RepID=UPI00047D78C5|nr:protein translocase subunit SecF [Clostridiisalibacter paucivorans]